MTSRLLIDNLNFPIICLDNQLKVFNLNKCAEKLITAEKRLFIGQPYNQLQAFGKNIIFPKVAQANITEAKLNNTCPLQETIVKKDNITTILNWTISIYSDEANNFSNGFLIVGNSSSSINMLSEKQNFSQVYLDNILKNIPCYIYWKDLNSIYLGCNEKFAQAAGLKNPSEIIGKTDFDLAWGETEARLFIEGDKKAFAGASKLDFEEPQLQADGKYATVLASKVPMRDNSGNIVGVLGIYMDITERKRMEEELREAKNRAEAANQAKSDFLAAVNHELRTPLTGMLGMARLLASEPLQPDHAQQVNDIITAGQHLLSLVNDLLDLAKLEAGKLELNITALDLRKLVEEVATMLSTQAKVKHLEMRVNFQEGTPHLIMGDAKAIRQILLNLLGNALKFTSEGYVEIAIECIEQTAKQAKLKLSVNDSGIGIPADKLESVFEKFNQVDNSRTRKYGGTGLGLTINKAYVELMGGEIKVKSEEGKGSSFYCVIPFPLQPEIKLLSNWEPYKSKVRILIIDETTRAEVIKRHIGSSLVEITSGNRALHYLLSTHQNNQTFDIVIIDRELKSTDAKELAKKINTQRSMPKPLLLMMIPNASLPSIHEAKQAGFFDCLIKPAHPTELLSTLTAAWERWLERLQPKQKIETISNECSFKVLLVEDDPIIQKVHKIMLEKVGCQVVIAVNGQEALEIYQDGYELIFMDVGLGTMSGFDVAKEIRRLENGVRIPIVAMTGYGDDDSKNSCFASGMDDIVIKPTTPERLKEILQKWINR